MAPSNAYPPGAKLTVGSHEVEIIDFIGEGGFAHVYTVHVQPPVPGQEVACLKRVQVPDKAYLNLLRAEVDAMQRLRGSSNIVQYIDSHAERMHTNEIHPVAKNALGRPLYEVFLLMEYCSGGGLIDFMNTRLRDQLREHEVLKIMYDITLGLSHMHYLVPPLLHRDLKIENVLISAEGEYKLCDFGSVSPVLRPPKSAQELKILEDDIQHHTTVQYRAPEMVDLSLGYPVDEKSDIWALGVFLYKLCYYTTPFERPNQTYEQFTQLILQGSYTIPPRPAYSDRLRNMICVLLQPNPRMRPNVFQVLQEICSMRHVPVPIRDIYSRLAQGAPAGSGASPGAPVGAAQMPMAVPPGQMGQLGVAGSQPLGSQPLQLGSQLGAQPGAQPGSQSLGSQVPVMGAPVQRPITPYQQPRFAPGVPHYVPPVGTFTAPGKVSVPGVLLTSPAVEPLSPSRSGSMSPIDELSARFPSLEELDKLAAKPKTAKPEKAAALSRSKSMGPASRQRSRDEDAALGGLSGASASALGIGAGAGSETNVSEEAQKLKRILTGISGRSSTVILDREPADSNLSSVDFLRTLRQPDHRKKKYSGEYDRDAELDDDDDEPYEEGRYQSRYDSAYEERYRDGYEEPYEEPYEDGDSLGYSDSPEEYVPDADLDFDFGKPAAKPAKPAKPPRPAKLPLTEADLKPAKPQTPKPSISKSVLSHSKSVPDIVGEKPLKPAAKPHLPVKAATNIEKTPPLGSLSKSAPTTAKTTPKVAAPVATKSPATKSPVTKTTAAKSPATKTPATKTPAASKPALAKAAPAKPAAKAAPKAASAAQSAPAKPAGPAAKPVKHAATMSAAVLAARQTEPITTAAAPSKPLGHLLKTRPKSAIIGETISTKKAGELDSFKPSNAIQQRVHRFLSSHDRQHPPKRTAQGYGRFTESSPESVSSSDDELYEPLPPRRSFAGDRSETLL